MNLELMIHAFSCFFMTGVVWLVQVLVYPQIKLIGQTEFSRFHEFHVKQITKIVAPVMGIELLTGLWLLSKYQNQIYTLNFLSVLSVWAYTGLVSVPSHNKLNYDSEKSKNFLIWLNWPRVVIWTSRSILLIYLFLKISRLNEA